MPEINLLDHYPKVSRNLGERQAVGPEDRYLAKQFGREYFDGTRNQGYGGFRYDGRWKPIVKRFQQHYGLSSTSQILDVGCAKGFMLHDFLELIAGITVAGIDISQYAIDNAMQDVKPFVRVGNANALPYPDKYYDLVIAINTIHNLKLPDLVTSLQEIMRVSRQHSFVVVDAYRTEEERARLLQWNLTAETHMFVSEWEKLFKEIGFTGDYFWFTP